MRVRRVLYVHYIHSVCAISHLDQFSASSAIEEPREQVRVTGTEDHVGPYGHSQQTIDAVRLENHPLGNRLGSGIRTAIVFGVGNRLIRSLKQSWGPSHA